MAEQMAPQTVQIAVGQSTTAVFSISGFRTLGFILPANLTPTTLSFLVAQDTNSIVAGQDTTTATPVPLFDDAGNEVTITVPAGGIACAVSFPNAALSLAPWKYIQIRGGTHSAAVNQASTAASIIVVGKE